MVLRDITIKNNTPLSLLRGGYTLIELTVVVSIVVFVSIVILVNTKGSDRALAVKRQSNDIALSLAKARDNAASSTPYLGQIVYGYGVRFNLQSDKQSYIIFADTNNNAKCDDVACGCTFGCKQELVEKRILDSKTTLDNLGMNSADSLSYCSTTTCSSLTVYFCPPNPNTFIFGQGAAVTAPFNCSASNLNPNNIARGDIIVAGLGGGTNLQSKGIITVRKTSAIQVGYSIMTTPVPPPPSPPALPSENLTQIRYHWRNDVGGETTANSATGGTENTILKNVLKNETKRLRIEIANKGSADSASISYRIEFRAKGSSCGDDTVGTWRDVQTGPEWNMANNSGGIINASATSDVNPISSGGVNNENPSFKAGYFMDTSSITPSMTLTASEFTELEYSIRAGGPAPDGETYCFRVTNAAYAAGTSSATNKFTYQIYPELTLAGPSLAQIHYRWRADDGDEPAPPPIAGASWATAEDTKLENLIEGNQRRLRIEISNRGEDSSLGAQYQLEYRLKSGSSCGGTGWGKVPALIDIGYSTSPWQIVNSAIVGVTDGEATTNFLGSLTDDPGKTFAPGRLQEATNLTASITLSKTQFTELEFSIRPTAFAQDGTTTCFRLTNAGSTAAFDYILYPEVGTAPAPEISVSDISKYAWNPSAGWISFRDDSENRVVKVGIVDFIGNGKILSTGNFVSFNCASAPKAGGDCTPAGSSDYKVTRDSSGNVFGWAWSDDYGWISLNCANDFNPSLAGVQAQCLAQGGYDYKVTINVNDGAFHGWAWNDILGWISFNCAENSDGVCVSSNYEVRLESPLPQGSNVPPDTKCNVDPLTGSPGTTTFNYDALGTSDFENNYPITYSWDLDGNGVFGDATDVGPVQKVYQIDGRYTAQVRGTDNVGNSKVVSCAEVTVSNPPVMTSCVRVSSIPPSGYFLTTDQIRYRISASDPDNNQIYYTINWGDLSASRVPSTGMVFDDIAQDAYKIYSAQGTFIPNVTVTDSFGVSSSPAYNCPSVIVKAVPTTPTLSAVRGNQQVALSWLAPSDDGGSPITNYKIYRGTTSGNLSLLTTVGNVLSYNNIELTNGTTYYYQVAAVTVVGEGFKSNEVSAKPATVPSAPGGLLAISGDAQITLNWNAPSSDGGDFITTYSIYRGTSSGNETFLQDTGSAGLSFIDIGLNNGTTYYYKVSAKNPVGESLAQSNEASSTPVGLPGAPQNLAVCSPDASPCDDQLILTWNPPLSDGGSSIIGYTIYRQDRILPIAQGATSPYTDTDGITNGAQYCYTVKAVNVRGVGPESSLVCFTPAAAPFITAQNATSVAAFSATLQSLINPGGAATTVWYRYGTSNGTCSDTFGSVQTSDILISSGTIAVQEPQSVSNLLAGTTYYFCAIAENWQGRRYGAVLSFKTTIGLRNVATNGTSAADPNLPINKPAGVVTGDIMVAAIFTNSTVTITPPDASWSTVLNTVNSTLARQIIFMKIATASEPASYTFTFSSSIRAAGGIAAYAGVNTATPLNGTPAGNICSSSCGATINVPSVTTSVQKTMVLAFLGKTNNNPALGQVSNMTEHWDVFSTGPNPRIESSQDDLLLGTSGATGTQTASGASVPWIAQIMALNPQ